MTKTEMADKIGEITGERPNEKDFSADQLREMFQVAASASTAELSQEVVSALDALRQPGGVTRRKVNRGSTRRINRALTAAVKALDDFAAEIDQQVYITDEKPEDWDDAKQGAFVPKRIGNHPLVDEVAEFRNALAAKVAEFTTPS